MPTIPNEASKTIDIPKVEKLTRTQRLAMKTFNALPYEKPVT
jgi:hypothetical protein